MNKKTVDVAKTMSVLPRFVRRFLGPVKLDLDIPIKKNELRALVELNENPDMPMRHYADTTDMELGSFTYLADKLEKKGFVKRVQSETDKRITLLTLTSEGIEISRRIRESYDAHIAEMMMVLDEKDLDDISTAISLLENVLTKLEDK